MVFVIITDGHENSSREFQKAQVKDLVSKHGSWQFVFLGANVDAFAEARDLGIRAATTAQFDPTKTQDLYLVTSDNIRNFRTGVRDGISYDTAQRMKLQ